MNDSLSQLFTLCWHQVAAAVQHAKGLLAAATAAGESSDIAKAQRTLDTAEAEQKEVARAAASFQSAAAALDVAEQVLATAAGKTVASPATPSFFFAAGSEIGACPLLGLMLMVVVVVMILLLLLLLLLLLVVSLLVSLIVLLVSLLMSLIVLADVADCAAGVAAAADHVVARWQEPPVDA